MPAPCRQLRAFVLAAALAAGIATAAAAAAHGNLSTHVDGTVTSGAGDFDGSLVVSSFELRDGKLVALGSLDGSITGADKKTTEMADRDVVMVVDRAALSSTCDRAKVRLQGMEVADGATRVKLEPVELEIAAKAAPGAGLHDSLCELTRLLGTSAGDDVLGKQLGLVLGALE